MFEILCFIFFQISATRDTIFDLKKIYTPDIEVMRFKIVNATSSDAYGGVSTNDSGTRNYQNIVSSAWFSAFVEFQRLSANRFVEFHLSANPWFDYPLISISGSENIFFPDSLDNSKDWNLSFSTGLYELSEAGWYIGNSDWFLGFKDSIDLLWQVRNFDWEKWAISYPIFRGDFFIGGGVGHIRDAASAYKAWSILDEIHATSKERIYELADLISQKYKYESEHILYEKYLYSDIEALLKNQGAVERLNPFQAMRVREVVQGIPENRFSGTRLFAGMGMTMHRWFDYLPEGRWFGLYTDIQGGNPLSRKCQLDWNGRCGFFTSTLSDFEYAIEGRGKFSYIVNEISEINIGSVLYHWHFSADRSMTGIGYELPVGFLFNIEDKVSIFFDLKYDIKYATFLELESSSYLSHSLDLGCRLTWRLR